jgi:hypothetical protein
MKKRILAGLAGVTFVAIAGTGAMAAPATTKATTSGNKLQCFDGASEGYGNGVCSLRANGTATLTNPAAGDYSGVYVLNNNVAGKRLADINQLGFSFTGDSTGGSPRITFPVDIDGDGAWDDFVSADALGCSDGAGNVDVINDTTCLVSFNGGSGPAANSWAEFVALNPTVRVSNDGQVPFVIADQAGSYQVSNVRIGRSTAKTR